MRRALAVLLAVMLVSPGCATARMAHNRGTQRPAPAVPDRALLAAYLKQLPVGSKVRASLSDGKTIRGTLMLATDERIVVQRRTRIPEPPTDISIDKVSAVDLDAPTGTGRVVGVAVAAGAGAALGTLLLLFAIFAGSD